MESVVILFFKHMNEKLPCDQKWHKTLLEMAFGANSKNIRILSIETKNKLEKYLYFRHFIRHSYSSELNWNLMGPLVKEIEDIWMRIKTDFKYFIENN